MAYPSLFIAISLTACLFNTFSHLCLCRLHIYTHSHVIQSHVTPSQEHAEALRRDAAALDVGMLLSCTADLLQKMETCDMAPTEPLKTYLPYVTEADIEAAVWWPLLPDSLQLQHTHALHTLLATFGGQ